MRRLNIIKVKYATFFIAITIVWLAIFPTFMRYRVEVTANVTGYAKETRSSTYKVKFHNNGGTGTMDDMTITYDVAQNLTKNIFTYEDYHFAGWNTELDGSGTNYSDEQEIKLTSYTTGNEINLYAQWVSGIAEVNGTIFPTVQAAIDSVTTTTPTIVKLLTNAEEKVTVAKTKNIIFDLQNYTMSWPTGTDGVIENYGTISISNGTVKSSAVAAVINNYKGATLNISGGNLIGTSSKKGQAIYNKGGTVYISGNAYLSSNSSDRATVHNLADGTTQGTVSITGGTIISNGFSAIINVKNSVPIIIGTNDGTVDKTTPIIQGETYGLNIDTSGSYELYDGIIKGKTQAINNENTIITSHETDYNIAHSEEIIDGKTYKTAYLAAIAHTITFNANGGTVSETSRNVESGNPIGALPEPTWSGHIFDGWFTSAEGGEQISSSTIVTGDDTYYAHWSNAKAAKIGQIEYDTLQEAIDAVPSDTQTTIILLRNTKENITIEANKKIEFDLSNYTISNNSVNPVVTNAGTLKITNGIIRQTSAYAAINNYGNGKIIMTGGRVLSTGGRSAIYSKERGIVEISGTAYLESNASGVTETYERGTVMSVSNRCSTTITGGTIVSTAGLGISDIGTLTIGVKSDGNIDSSAPIVSGETYGVYTTGTFNLYDGKIKGITDAINGTIADQEPGTQIVNGTDIVNDKTYITAHLELIP